MEADYERLRQQALQISELLRFASIGPCTLTEGVQELIRQRDENRDTLAQLEQHINAAIDQLKVLVG